MKKLKKWRESYYNGPDWIRLPDLLICGRYKSPTMLIGYWLYAWYLRWLTWPGRLIVLPFPLLLDYMIFSVQTPIHILIFTMMAVMTVDFCGGMIFRPRLRIIRHAPPRARVGSEITVGYELFNRRKLRPALDLEIDEYFRNKGLKFVTAPAAANIVPAQTRRHLQTRITAPRRGLYTLPIPIADSHFPLALFKWGCRDGAAQKLHVYPAFHVLSDLTLPVGRRFQKEGTSRVSKVGESLDFAGCRDFRSGDDPRHIHWSSTARRGKLVVKEYQEEYLSRVAVIVDTGIKAPRISLRLFRKMKPEYPQLEAAVSLTAALADFLARGDFVIDFFAAGPEVYHFKGGRSLACLDGILDILSCLEPNLNQPLERLTPLLLEEITGIGSAVIVLLGWNRERQELVETLRRHGVALKLIFIGDRRRLTGPEEALYFAPDDVLRGKVTRL
ncbi:MAG: DUF58 domain-containing protein [Victivallales bacterium]|nr:DUF58 domain-containing protein [Victivallales bacterium]